ncbi:unnamed protein product [Acanthoscelides obtectus]|uniref:Uncharacterized protein n=1 Tax=Acanthoscelides obtectus TaxID=200917 RepID=A0A9P0K9P5_ACAOB|nr:unnamed protein product [Acanthoscelides obtectus]CAK1657675.1 Centrosomal protein of 192 kDa [Acanthoscelides obtectus]
MDKICCFKQCFQMGDRRVSAGGTSPFQQPAPDYSNRRATLNIEDSLQLLQVQGVNLKGLNGGSFVFSSRSSTASDLEQQRELARSSLQRASATGIPSKYLVPNYSKIDTISYNDSTISDSDLLGTPKNTSTPRSSQHIETSTPQSHSTSPRASSRLSSSSARSELKKTYKKDSSGFKPGEQAASMLLADELSWKRQNQILPVSVNEAISMLSEPPIRNVSIGEYFQQNFDNMSLFTGASSPPKSTSPVPLIDETVHTVLSDLSTKLEADFSGLSLIQEVIKDMQCTPATAAEKLLKKTEKKSRPSSTYVKEIPSVPMSKNSSYSTDHSDNEALRSIVEKENRNTLNITGSITQGRIEHSTPKSPKPSLPSSPRSCQSRASTVHSRSSSSVPSRSTSSVLTSLPGGRLPIDSDKTELIWGCVKVGRCDTQEFRLRNKSSKKLGLQLNISGQNYKIRKDSRQDSEPLTSFKMLMQPHEVKTIKVSFIPTRTGAAVGQLSFTPIDHNLKSMSNQIIKLWGYGGSTKIDLKNLSRDTSGRFWLSLGTLNNSSLMVQKFSVKNTGLLPGFIHLSLVSKDLFKVTVTPSFFALISQEEKEVTVTYRQTSEDRAKFSKLVKDNMVVDLGTLIATSGEEVTRGRLRQLCKQSIARNEDIDDLSNMLMQRINGEVMPEDLAKFKEDRSNIQQVLKLLTRKEIVLTIEMDPDETIIPQFLDDSEMFQTLLQDDSSAGLNETVVSTSIKLEPSTLILTVPKKRSDCLFLSCGRSKFNYEVSSTPSGLTVNPKQGNVEPGRDVVITVSYDGAAPEKRLEFNVTVSCNGHVLIAVVKVICDRVLNM